MSRKRVFISILFFILLFGASAVFVFAEQVNTAVGKSFVPEVSFQLGLDLQGGVHMVYKADLSAIPADQQDTAMESLRDVIERRVNLFGVQEPVVQLEGGSQERRLVVELAGIKDPAQAVALIGQTPYLEFQAPKENYTEILEQNTQVFQSGEGQLENPFESTLLTGRFLKKAELGFGEIAQEPVVILHFDEEGTRLFEQLTEQYIGRPLAIVLDGQIVQAPIVQEKITGGEAQITGSFSIQEAQRVVRELNAGALPVPISLLSQQQVGATLGKASLEQSLRAGLVAFLLVIVYLLVVYRMAGLMASCALLLYIVLLLALFKLVSITLTLAGIAGVILSVGMAVDANILIFSRVREELRQGKVFHVSLQEGFHRAWPSIRDGNVTTLLVALILFWLGSSFVQGFALALSLGIFLSMFSAIVVTKTLLSVFEKTKLATMRWLWL